MSLFETAHVVWQPSPEIQLAFFVCVVLTGVVSGIFVSTQLGQVRVQARLDAAQFVYVKQIFEAQLGSVMPKLMIITTLSPLPLLWLLRGEETRIFVLALMAFLLFVAATVVTVVLNVPVNKATAGWDAKNPPADWAEQRKRWHLGQTIRTVLCVPGFACLCAAAILSRH